MPLVPRYWSRPRASRPPAALAVAALVLAACARSAPPDVPAAPLFTFDPVPDVVLSPVASGGLAASVADAEGGVAVAFVDGEDAAVYRLAGPGGPVAPAPDLAPDSTWAPCRSLLSGEAEAAVGLESGRDAAGVLRWPGPPTAERYPVHLSGAEGAVAVLSSASPPEAVRGPPVGGVRFPGPAVHEAFARPGLERVAGPVRVELSARAPEPDAVCWTPSGRRVVYLGGAHAAVAPGLEAP